MNNITMARKMRKMITDTATLLSDEEALTVPYAYPAWEDGKAYEIGDRLRYGDILYKCLISHTAQSDWTPDISVSLWARVLAEDIREWERPDSTNPYMKGDKVRFDGKIYESLIDYNVYSPAEYPAGWKEVS